MRLPPPSLESKLLAAGTLVTGIGAALGLILVAKGYQKELAPFGIAAAITGMTVGTVRLLDSEEADQGG